MSDTQRVRRGTCRATQLDPYLPFVRDTLAQYPRLRATRIFEMVRGYTGSVVQLRRAMRLIRPAATGTMYRRLTTRHAGDLLQQHRRSLGSHSVWGGLPSGRSTYNQEQPELLALAQSPASFG